MSQKKINKKLKFIFLTFLFLVLLIVIFAIGDAGNAPPTEGMSPLVLMWLITGIGATLGWQTAYGELKLIPLWYFYFMLNGRSILLYFFSAVNPIRDWGPRIALTIVGYEGEHLVNLDGSVRETLQTHLNQFIRTMELRRWILCLHANGKRYLWCSTRSFHLRFASLHWR